MTWTIILSIFAGTFTARAAGPMLLRDRVLPARVEHVLIAIAVALLAALVAVGTVTRGHDLAIDARLGGLAVAAVAAWRRAPFVVIIASAAATAALLRFVGIG